MSKAVKVYVVGYEVDDRFVPMTVELSPQDAVKYCGIRKRESSFFRDYLKVYWTFTGAPLTKGLSEYVSE